MHTMAAPPSAPSAPLDEHELDELQSLLDAVPAPLEPLDLGMLDGFLCGVLVQPVKVPASRWLPHVGDVDGRALPKGFDAARLHALAQRRHAELDAAITHRQWFDPWVFEPEDEESSEIEAVLPWVDGFATAMEVFPALMDEDAPGLTEPLALVFRHLDPEALEDADELLAEIEMLEPPQDLTSAVEELVRATLLLADVSRPLPAVKGSPKGPAKNTPARGAPRGASKRPPPRRR